MGLLTDKASFTLGLEELFTNNDNSISQVEGIVIFGLVTLTLYDIAVDGATLYDPVIDF